MRPQDLPAGHEDDVPVKAHVLVNQEAIAAELYRHEDLLNWQKLNNLLYINVGLGAALGFTLDTGNGAALDVASPVAVKALAVLGALVCLAFAIAIWAGTIYLQNRKLALRLIERRLRPFGGAPMVHLRRFATTRSKLQRFSLTMIVLRGFPLALAFVWITIGLLAFGGVFG